MNDRPNFDTLCWQLWEEVYPDQLAAAQKAEADVEATGRAYDMAKSAHEAALHALPGASGISVEPWIYHIHKRDGITMEAAREKFAAMMESTNDPR